MRENSHPGDSKTSIGQRYSGRRRSAQEITEPIDVSRERVTFVPASDGTPLFVRVTGQGPLTVVLNDGIGCDGFAWRYLEPAFAEHYQVIHWHYRGHGRSGKPQDPNQVGIEHLADDLRVVLDELGIERAALIGHSMGTQVALEAYRHAPEQVVALGLFCGSYGRVTHTFHGTDLLHQILPKLIDGLQRYTGLGRALWGRIPASVAFQAARLGGEVDGGRIQEADFRRYWDHVSLMDPGTFLHMLKHAGDHSAEDLLPDVAVPTLVIAAEKDTFTPHALAKQMADNIPNAKFLMIAKGSHAAPVEQPDIVIEATLGFLQRAIE